MKKHLGTMIYSLIIEEWINLPKTKLKDDEYECVCEQLCVEDFKYDESNEDDKNGK